MVIPISSDLTMVSPLMRIGSSSSLDSGRETSNREKADYSMDSESFEIVSAVQLQGCRHLSSKFPIASFVKSFLFNDPASLGIRQQKTKCFDK